VAMPYTLEWYQPQRIILFKLVGKMSEEEVEQSSHNLYHDFLEPGQAPVHILYDSTDLTDYPRNLILVRHAATKYMKHPKLGWLIIYGPDNLTLRFLGKVVSQIMRVQFRYVSTKEDALEILHRIDLSTDRATS
jgi:hypothetical protein